MSLASMCSEGVDEVHTIEAYTKMLVRAIVYKEGQRPQLNL